ncbi:unnamed protein product [Brassica rapa subsp. trilocularis]
MYQEMKIPLMGNKRTTTKLEPKLQKHKAKFTKQIQPWDSFIKEVDGSNRHKEGSSDN